MELKKERDYTIVNGCISLKEKGKKVIEEIEQTTGILEIPEGIIVIPGSFVEGVKLKKLILPSSLETIGDSAFATTGLEEIIGGENVRDIRDFAFAYNNLKKVCSLKNLEKISVTAFYANKIEEFYFPKSLELIDDKAFYGNNFTKVDLSECKNLSIKFKSFGKNRINELIVNKNLEYDKNAFRYNELSKENVKGKDLNLEYANVKELVKYVDVEPDNSWKEKHFIIENGAFTDFSEEGLKKLCKAENITFPYIKGVNTIDISFTAYPDVVWSGVRDVYINEGIKKINSYVFDGLDIEKVHFPKSLEVIGDYAFEDTCIEGIKISGKLKELGFSAFSKTPIEFLDISNTEISEISAYAFSECGILKEVKLPKKLKNIYDCAFKETSSLCFIKFPKTLEEIGSSVFQDSGLRNVEFEDCRKLREIDSSAFESCKISYIPFEKMKNLQVIGASAFFGNDLTEVKIKKAEKVCPQSFELNNIKQIRIEDVKKLSKFAFTSNPVENCEIFEDVEFIE